jgi:hypothetical protein
MMLVIVVFSVRIAHDQPRFDGPGDDNSGLTSSAERALVDQILAAYPDLPAGSRLELLGLPQRLIITRRGIQARFRLAVELYYDHVTVVGAWSKQEFLAHPPPPGMPTYRVTVHCVVKRLTLQMYSVAC